MPNPEDFDDFYLSTRRRLVLQAYALTGDLSASRQAVREAFVAARHHWRKVGRLPDPEEWVRQRAWTMAQRRHVARLWHREKGITAEQKSVLDTLHKLSDQQRKVLLLTHLAALSSAEIGRELGERPSRVEEQLAQATRSYSWGTGTEPADLQRSLESLGPIAEATALPAPAVVDRGGRRRRRLHLVAGTAALLALVVAGGLFVVTEGANDSAGAQPKAAAARPVEKSMLVSPAQVQDLAPRSVWRLLGTSDNTQGTGINTVCQETRFADPRGRGTFVRKYAATGTPRRTYLETIEISRSDVAAQQAYRTTLGWFAGCSRARLQLLNAYRIQGLADQAMVLKLRIPNKVRRTYVVGVARTGSLTISTVSETLGGSPVPVARALRTLTSAVRNVCHTDAAGTCPTTVTASPVLPPPSGETRGTLAAADLPVVGAINRPWIGTKPVPARPNVAATTCDKANFVRAGAPRAVTRTFLVPQGRLPRRFGITETYGAFRTPRQAHAFVQRVSAAMAVCEKKDLGAEVSSTVVQTRGYRGSEYALWRLDSEIDNRSKVGFWMGIARVGRYVAQVNFTPVGSNDVDEDTFQALITRARDRLFELR
ncbi:MAG: sigma factor-like helix-turn-helix DNA-binding protein [Marmoricola sp.]